MIITLVKADFSANNIGQLSSFNVLTNILGGAIYSGPTSVKRGDSLHATISFADGCELLQMNVMMGGAVFTDYSTENNNIILNIPEVTGVIVINIIATGENITPPVVNVDPIAAAILHHGAEFPAQATGEYAVNVTGSTVYYIYENIPVKANRTYRLAYGRACFFLDSNKQPLIAQYVNLTSSYTDWTFETPANCAYITVAFKYSDAQPEAIKLESVATWGNPVTTLLKDTGAIYTAETAVESGKTAISNYAGFYTYSDIPVTGGKKYKMENCRLSFWSDVNKNFISQINFNSNSSSATTKDWSHIAPENAAYLTVCVKNGDIDKDAVAMVEYTMIED